MLSASQTLSTIAVLAATLGLGLAAPAFAQDEGEPEEGGEGTEGTEGDGSGGEGTEEGTGEAAAPGAEASMYTKETWPQELTKRPISLAKGMVEVRVDLGINLTADFVGTPIFLAPDVYYGVDDKLTVGLTHERGLCFNGTKEVLPGVEVDACGSVYNDLGLDAIFAFMTGELNLGAHGGLRFGSIDPFYMDLKVGVLGKYMTGKLAVTFDPHLAIGLNKRDEGNGDQLNIPVEVAFQASPQLAPFLRTGIGGPLDGFGDAYAIPLGVGALYTMSPKLDVGGVFTFGNLAGANSSADVRQLDILVNFRL